MVGLVMAWLVQIGELGAPLEMRWLVAAAEGTGLRAHLAGWAWFSGGATGLSWLQYMWGLVAVWWPVTLGLILFLVLGEKYGWPRRWTVMGTCCALVISTAVGVYRYSERAGGDPPATEELPFDLVRGGGTERTFLSPTARLAAILLGHDASPIEPGWQDPARWREQMRASGWTTAILAGNPSDYSALLTHLSRSPDWNLERVTPVGYRFERTGHRQFDDFMDESSIEDNGARRAWTLAMYSEKLEALGHTRRAAGLLEQALDTDPESPAANRVAAMRAAKAGDWALVRKHASRLPVGEAQTHYLLAGAALESGDPVAAIRSARRACALAPESGAAYLLLARALRADGSRGEEAQALRRLLAIEEKAGRPTGGVHLYLAQAILASGDHPGGARYHLRMAGESEVLDAEQRATVREILSRLDLLAPERTAKTPTAESQR